MLYCSNLDLIDFIVAPGKDRTVAFVFRSLFLTLFKIELPTNNVGSLIYFFVFVSLVRSITSVSVFGFVFTVEFGFLKRCCLRASSVCCLLTD